MHKIYYCVFLRIWNTKRNGVANAYLILTIFLVQFRQCCWKHVLCKAIGIGQWCSNSYNSLSYPNYNNMPPYEWWIIGEFIVHCLIPVSYHIMHPHDICVFLYLSDVIVNLTRASISFVANLFGIIWQKFDVYLCMCLNCMFLD